MRVFLRFNVGTGNLIFMICYCTLIYEVGERSKITDMAQGSGFQSWLFMRIIRGAFKKYPVWAPVF